MVPTPSYTAMKCKIARLCYKCGLVVRLEVAATAHDILEQRPKGMAVGSVARIDEEWREFSLNQERKYSIYYLASELGSDYQEKLYYAHITDNHAGVVRRSHFGLIQMEISGILPLMCYLYW